MIPAMQSSNKQSARVLLLIPSAYLFYLNQGLALRQAFLNQGVDCMLLTDGMNEESMLALLSGYQPQAVISINSSKYPVMEQFPGMLHIRWVQDNQFGNTDFRKESQQSLSDICYFATTRLQNTLPLQGKTLTGILRFASTPSQTDYSADTTSIFSLIGYIPPTSLLNAAFEVNPFKKFSGWDYLSFLEAVQQNSLDTSLEILDQIVETFLNIQGTRSQNVSEEVLKLFREEYMRAANRSRLVKKVLSLGHGCRIYGTPEWTTWPEFSPYFQGPLSTLQQNCEVFRSTALNLHNGGTVSHPRVFDCMAALGGPLMVNRTPVETELGFEPGVHYVEYDLSDFDVIARDLIQSPDKRQAISQAAYAHICQHHTWDHRARQIIADCSL